MTINSNTNIDVILRVPLCHNDFVDVTIIKAEDERYRHKVFRNVSYMCNYKEVKLQFDCVITNKTTLQEFELKWNKFLNSYAEKATQRSLLPIYATIFTQDNIASNFLTPLEFFKPTRLKEEILTIEKTFYIPIPLCGRIYAKLNTNTDNVFVTNYIADFVNDDNIDAALSDFKVALYTALKEAGFMKKELSNSTDADTIKNARFVVHKFEDTPVSYEKLSQELSNVELS